MKVTTTPSIADLDKFRAHSILLNRVIWEMLLRLGDVDETSSEHECELEEVIDRFFASTTTNPKDPE